MLVLVTSQQIPLSSHKRHVETRPCRRFFDSKRHLTNGPTWQRHNVPVLPIDHPLSRHASQTVPSADRTSSNGCVSASPVDLVLSSGFLAFAGHAGFLAAVEDSQVVVGGIMGTSSGALAGALFSAGYSAQQVAEELSRVPPIQLLRPSCKPWEGVWDLRGVVARLTEVLPPTFSDLERPFAVGVVNSNGRHRVVASGPLPTAVAASAAVPIIFRPVSIPGVGSGFLDGGMVDRIGLQPWREHCRSQQQKVAARSDSCSEGEPLEALSHAIVHLIGRSSPFSGEDDVSKCGEKDITMIDCPRSRASFFDLGAFQQQYDAARANGLAVLRSSALCDTVT